MNYSVNDRRMWQWALGSAVLLVSLVWWMKPVHAYYLCTQEDGTQLFTDNPDRDCVKKKDPALSPSPTESIDAPAQSAGDSDEVRLPEGEEVDDEGHNREWWQRKLRALIKERDDTLAAIAAMEAQLRRYQPPHLMYFKIKEDIEGLSRFLEWNQDRIKNELPEAARKAGAPPGWVRE